MPEQPFAAKDIRLISDILALILDEQSGQAAAALEKLRNRARKRKMTGGTLKNIFLSIAQDHVQPGRTQAWDETPPDSLRKENLLLNREVQTLLKRNRHLQEHFAQLQQDNKALRHDAAFIRSQAPLRRAALVLALIAGLFVGIAATEFVHSLNAPPKVDRSVYLR